MEFERKRALLEKLEEHIQTSGESTQKANEVATEFADATPSQSGDRYIYETQAQMLQETLKTLHRLRREISETSETSLEKAKPLSFVTIQYDDGTEVEFLFSNISGVIPGFQIITPESSLGASILNKQPGEKFMYSVKYKEQQLSYEGKIIKVE